jgi:ribosome-associated heat shock protein Hsp15
MDEIKGSVRIDKWLWAARFFKTRRLAHDAIEAGKIHIGGQKCKASKKVMVGLELKIRQGYTYKIIKIMSLSEVRRGAPEAELLYKETQESIQKRSFEAEMKKMSKITRNDFQKPTKKQRRDILNFKKKQNGDVE